MDKILKPDEILEASLVAAADRANSGFVKLLVLAVLGGAFIAFGAEGSSFAAYGLLAEPSTFGLGKALAGAIFPVGLILVVIAGAELFTGNVLIAGSVAAGRVSCGGLLRNWGIVYIGNFIGAMLIAWFIVVGGQLHSGADLLGAVTIKIAAGKASLSFPAALVLGILCNWLVCLAVWLAYASSTVTGKIAAIFFPIMVFVLSGFEHSVANMYYIPAGIFAKADPALARAAMDIGVTQQQIDGLTWASFLGKNLPPVTLGNIIGGVVFVSFAYIAAYGLKKRNSGPYVTDAKSLRDEIRKGWTDDGR
ncbi:MAG: formate/nitrite transporter family protein [Clostridiales Family XIII bacterium]|jgi:formate/nitrite transporter|nr:formate/nitrite transporter family protein [Clostridiales Family XIII bacterium]